jgi:RNA polymerase sigma factor (sigma-70 family)
MLHAFLAPEIVHHHPECSMERQPFDLYRVLRRQFPRVDQEDLVEAVREAVVVSYLSDHQLQGGIRNVEAFSTIVARRSLGRELRRQRRLVHPDRAEQYGWDEIDVQTRTMIDEEATCAAAIDASDIMEAMPDNYAEVMRMHYMEGLTLEEAAQRAGVTSECMRKRHERAIKWARRRFGRAE